jgi:indole-3-glycerol phosphate synthase
MRKDFLVDPYQVLEARAHGAGGVLLIVRMVTRARLVAMLDEAAAQGLFVLLEAFDADDLRVARSLANERRGRREQVLMGLNCRDLQSLQIDFERFERLRDELPTEWPAVAESGVTSPADAARVARLGYQLALVGTSLMQRDDPAVAVRELLEAGRAARSASASQSSDGTCRPSGAANS